eukprot:TRINITY_DN24535_c0_g1_i2.p1 TRINITY_DN24535_c0_g1~~TRINITY_DN24535_c0_g1_i2.p1  ORF type:complete len:920 (+),score=202.38 TRINITY_DN24535_c0_g1_i2:132-2891(+)
MGLLEAHNGVRLRISGVVGDDDDGGIKTIDEKQWKEQLVDLYQVMKVCNNLFLTFQHNSEAEGLLRVCLEIVLDRRSRNCIYWQDGWYADDGKRAHFRNVVQEKFRAAVSTAKGCQVEIDDFSPEEDEEMVKMRQQLAEAQAACGAAQKQQQLAEMQCREVQEEMQEWQSRAGDLEQTCDQLRKELRKAQEETQALIDEANKPKPVAKDETGALKQKLMMVEKERDQTQEKLIKTEDALKAFAPREELLQATNTWINKVFGVGLNKNGLGEAPSAAAGSSKGKDSSGTKIDMKEAKEVLIKCERMYKDALNKPAPKPAEVPKQAPAAEPPPPQIIYRDAPKVEAPPTPVDTGPKIVDRSAELEAALKDLEAERLRVQQLLENEKRLQDKLELSMQEMGLLKKKVSDAEERARQAEENVGSGEPRIIEKIVQAPPQIIHVKEEVKPQTPEVQIVRETDPALLAELQELRAMKKQFEEANEKIRKLQAANQKLRDQNAELEGNNERLLKTLMQVKEQLAKVMEIAERKGYGDLVKGLMDEAGLTDTLNSPEFTCFDRLYEDALRRHAKQRDVERLRLGFDPESGDDHSPKAFLRKGGGIKLAGGGHVSRAPAGIETGFGSYGGGYAYAPTRLDWVGEAQPEIHRAISAGRRCKCGANLLADGIFCRKCGVKIDEPGLDQPRARRLSHSSIEGDLSPPGGTPSGQAASPGFFVSGDNQQYSSGMGTSLRSLARPGVGSGQAQWSNLGSGVQNALGAGHPSSRGRSSSPHESVGGRGHGGHNVRPSPTSSVLRIRSGMHGSASEPELPKLGGGQSQGVRRLLGLDDREAGGVKWPAPSRLGSRSRSDLMGPGGPGGLTSGDSSHFVWRRGVSPPKPSNPQGRTKHIIGGLGIIGKDQWSATQTRGMGMRALGQVASADVATLS